MHCELAWSSDFRNWHRIDEGHDLVPLGNEHSFESHICYGSVPVHVPDENAIREYYFGGDGPHYGTRNSSLALITFREAGLAGVGAPSDWHSPVSGQLKPLNVTGHTVVVTADTDTLYGGGENPDGSPTLDNVGKLLVAIEVVVRTPHTFGLREAKWLTKCTYSCSMVGHRPSARVQFSNREECDELRPERLRLATVCW